MAQEEGKVKRVALDDFGTGRTYNQRMLATLILALLTASPASRFAEDGSRSADGQTLTELARQAVTAHPRGYSLSGASDHRSGVAGRAFGIYSRYNHVPNMQWARCHCGRIYDQIDQWYDQRQTAEPPQLAFSQGEAEEFKRACYAMLRAPEPRTRETALKHLVWLADSRDVSALTALLRRLDSEIDHGLVCLALGRVGDSSAIPAMARELDGPRWEEAWWAIYRIGGSRADAALKGRKKPGDFTDR